MALVLGIDAAWTPRNPSGVALVACGPQNACLGVAPSCASFVALANGVEVDWCAKPSSEHVDVAAIVAAAERMGGGPIDVIAVDMPVSLRRIAGRRAADGAVSKEFGSRLCSAHSPSEDRPGTLGVRLTEACRALGYSVATRRTPSGSRRKLVEVYPHPALLALLDRTERVRYKVAKAKRYWPELSPVARRLRILTELDAIRQALTSEFGAMPIPPFEQFAIPERRVLKTLEDSLDAAICAWVAVLYLADKAVALGDEYAAVWCPRTVLLPGSAWA